MYQNYSLIKASLLFGKQSIIISVDTKKNLLNSEYDLYSACGTKKEKITLEEHLIKCEKNGAGEFLLIQLIRME